MDDTQNLGATWDRKYEAGLPSLVRPDPFFVSAYERFIAAGFPRGGTGVDLAGGLGRHALWLAQREWRMTVVDVSAVAIGSVREEAGRLGLTLNLLVADAAEYDLRPAAYDVVILFYHFDRALLPRIVSSLRPGGFFLAKLAVPEWSETASSAQFLRKGEISRLVSGLDVIVHQERPVRNRGVVEFVARRPGSSTPAIVRCQRSERPSMTP